MAAEREDPSVPEIPEVAALPVAIPFAVIEQDFTLGCEHYKRSCQFVSHCCGVVYACRFCHDEVENAASKKGAAHQLDRFAVKELVCRACEARQPVSSNCMKCGVVFGRYACLTCKLFDHDTSKKQFHCEGCGICRVGGRENFIHCANCGYCYSITLKDEHKCPRNAALHVDCPVCCEYLFDSRSVCTTMECGHAIHVTCLHELQRSGHFKCPMCSHVLFDMTEHYAALEREIAETPMPEELRDRQETIACNDCHEVTDTAFHILGLMCMNCRSFNTARTVRK